MSDFKLPSYEYESKRVSVTKPLVEGEWNTLMDVKGPGIIKHIWITLPTTDRYFGRRNILRIYWDNEENPSVEAPICDFFCVPMGFTGTEYRLNNYFISLVPQNGMNCYFPMPFAKRAKVELLVNMQEMGYGFYFQADYEECREDLPEEWQKLRFHAKYRMENPTEEYGNRYLALDAEGEGYLVGVSYGIRRAEEKPDSWYHGGGDQVFIDGETKPYVIHGIGAEDFFGHSWGVDTSNTLYVGNPFIQKMYRDGRDYLNLVLYRFFVHDPIRFKSSIRHMLGAIGDSFSSVAYWYQTEPHKEFFKLPGDKELFQEARLPRLTNDITPEFTYTWNVFGPVRDEEPFTFEQTHPLETDPDMSYTSEYKVPSGQNADEMILNAAWTSVDAPRGFVDFHTKMRPPVFAIKLQTGCYAFALGYVHLDMDMDVLVRAGFDDRMRLLVNNSIVMDKVHDNGFENEYIPVKLKEGKNSILVKLSNTDNTNFRSWTFNLAFVDGKYNLLKDIKITER
jgi:hypothetical protein